MTFPPDIWREDRTRSAWPWWKWPACVLGQRNFLFGSFWGLKIMHVSCLVVVVVVVVPLREMYPPARVWRPCWAGHAVHGWDMFSQLIIFFLLQFIYGATIRDSVARLNLACNWFCSIRANQIPTRTRVELTCGSFTGGFHVQPDVVFPSIFNYKYICACSIGPRCLHLFYFIFLLCWTATLWESLQLRTSFYLESDTWF